MKKILLMALFFPAVCAHAADAKKGAATFQARCASCHGKDGKGSPGMAKMFNVKLEKLDLVKASAEEKPEVLTQAIAKGKGSKMPSFQSSLKDEEIKDVLTYIKSLTPAKAPGKQEGCQENGEGCH